MTNSTHSSNLTVRQLTPHIGAEATDVDLRNVTTDRELLAEVRKNLVEHQVVIFRDQYLDADELRLIVAQFGDIAPSHPILPPDKEEPDVYRIDSRPGPGAGRASVWHSDASFLPVSTAFAFLSMNVVPSVGGDTMWASLGHAYDTLSPAYRDFVDQFRAQHDVLARQGRKSGYNKLLADGVIGHWAGEQIASLEPQSHPLVQLHPETGRRLLYLSPSTITTIEGLADWESQSVLDFLKDHTTAPPNTVRISWNAGDIAVWDNRSTIHYAVDDFGSSARVGFRIHTYGSTPIPARP